MIALAAFVARPASAVVDGTRPATSFFGSIEMRADNLQPFRKWQAVLARSAAETEVGDAGCVPGIFQRCPYREWLTFLDSQRSEDRWRQLVAVNDEINRRAYVEDPTNWGVDDYWASPGEFLVRQGDCEDFAIAKFLSLKRLGWTDDELRLVAVRDLELGIGHAVLVAAWGGRTWLLDNQIRDVVDSERVRHYQPLFSINETAWWRHQVARP